MYQTVFFLPDLKSNHCFLVHIALTQLRPDITVFTNSLRKVILMELTCPYEENMVSYMSLCRKLNPGSKLRSTCT